MDFEVTLQLLKNGIVLGLLYGLFAYGLSMVLAATGIFHLAILTAMAGGAYGLWWSLSMGIPAVVAVLIALVAAGLVGYLTEVVIYRPLRKVGASDLVLLVGSLTVLNLGQALAAIFFGSDSKALSPNAFISWRIEILGINFTAYDVMTIVVSLLVFAALFVLQRRTRMGLAFRALGDNAELARLKGVRVNLTYVVLFIVISIIAGLGGTLFVMNQPAAPTMGFQLLIMAVIAMAVGGVGSMSGAMIAGLGVGLVESFLAFFTSSPVAHLVLFGMLFLLMVLRPKGFRLQATREA